MQPLAAETEVTSLMQVYDGPDCQAVLGARLQMPPIALAYNVTGDKLVAAGDDENIHVINIRKNKDKGPPKVVLSA